MILKTKYKRIIISGFVLLVLISLYRYSPYKIEFLGHYDKIWAHRVNTIDKLIYALPFYDGVELDLVYQADSGNLDVNHPPTESITLNFETYLSALDENQKPFLWLDIKNLTPENSHTILKRLTVIFDSKDFPLEKILIETRFPESLPIFTKKGFMTSYYLPSDLKDTVNSSHLKKIEEIKRVLKKQPKIGISTTYKDYDILKKYFKSKKKYIWILNHSKLNDYSKIQSILKDTTVKVVLTSYKSIKGNR